MGERDRGREAEAGRGRNDGDGGRRRPAQPVQQTGRNAKQIRKAESCKFKQKLRQNILVSYFFASSTHRLCLTRHSGDAGGLCWVKQST